MYRWVDHTAEVELAIEAPSQAAVFAEATAALAELLGFAGQASTETRHIVACAGDRATLLAAWLEELIFLAESEGFVGLEVRGLDFSHERVEATVMGAVGEPPPLVKAVTYHRLSFETSPSGYVANVVLDV